MAAPDACQFHADLTDLIEKGIGAEQARHVRSCERTEMVWEARRGVCRLTPYYVQVRAEAVGVCMCGMDTCTWPGCAARYVRLQEQCVRIGFGSGGLLRVAVLLLVELVFNCRLVLQCGRPTDHLLLCGHITRRLSCGSLGALVPWDQSEVASQSLVHDDVLC